MTKRTDPHRPGIIVPAHYSYVLSYSLPTVEGGFPVPPVNLDRVLELRASQPFAKTGGPGKCSVCGASYRYGDVWRHEPTGEHVHVGHDCAEKYRLLADRSAMELALGRARRATAVAAAKAQKAEDREAFLAANPGLAEALKEDHPILRDMAERFSRVASLSPKQVAFALKLAHEARNPTPTEKHVPAPEGKQTFRGVVVSLKTGNDTWGTLRMTVKVTTPEGVWLAWGTCPAALLNTNDPIKGREVEVTATLARGNEPHFAFFRRPQARFV